MTDFPLNANSATPPLLILVDGHSLAFRAYHAFAHTKQGPLQTKTGIPTSVCFGFLNSLLQVIGSQQPQFIAIAFDRSEPSFRHQKDPKYKANRAATPEEFIPDLNNLQQILTQLKLPIITAAGYEADDVLGTLAIQASQAGYRVKILTGDRDLFQLVDQEKQISVLYLERNAVKSSTGGGYTEFDPAAVVAKLGVKPTQVVDYKALCGDASDNIPGVRGIGEKTASKLLQTYDNLAEIYANINNIKGVSPKKLQEGYEDAQQSRYLAQLALDVPLGIDIKDCQFQGFNLSAVKPLLEKLELQKIIDKIRNIQFPSPITITSNNDQLSQDSSKPVQLSLFTQEKPVKPPTIKNQETVNAIKINPQIIDTPKKLTQLINHLKNCTNNNMPVAWDTETSSLEEKDAILVGLGCCWGENLNDVAYIPLNHTQGQNLDIQKALSALVPILENESYPKVFQNTKFDRLILENQGIKLKGVVFDTLLASYVLHPESSHKLSELCTQYLPNIVVQDFKDLKISKGETIADIDINRIAEYCGLDAYATYNLVPKLQAELQKNPDLYKILLEIEQPLEPILAAMESCGIRIDQDYLKTLSQQLEKDLQTIEKNAYEVAGESFNLNSPKQLSSLLFEHLGLNPKKSRKTKTGYSTDHATLEKLQGDHPVIDYILEHRTLAKLKSTYVDALPALIHPKTQRIHTDFNQAVTVTGRLSSSNPNLQNIPIRTEFSRKIRKAFLPEAGWILVSADYSQIELRILAHLSQEPVLLEAYQNQQDVHRVTAQLLFDKTDINAEERTLGKTINFGVIYGMGAQRFARESGLSVAEGKQFITKYHRTYSHVFAYLERVKREAIAQGYVTTIKGRRRYFEFVSGNLKELRGTNPDHINLDELDINYTDAQLLRAAANAPIQGSSADIIKIAMVKLQQILQQYQARLLLQVHDELVLEVPPNEWVELQSKIKLTMENAVNLTVPLLVEINGAENWMEAK
jgi:DNA polymerase-1